MTSTLSGFDALIADCERAVAQHQHTLTELLDRIEHYKRLREQLIAGTRSHQEGVAPRTGEPTAIDEFALRERERTTSTAWKVRKKAFLALRSVGRPMTRTELLGELLAMGVEFKSKDPAKTIGKVLWEAEEFEHTNIGYWIKGEPIRSQSETAKRHRAKSQPD